MSTAAIEKMRLLKNDFTYYAPRLLRIRTKDGQLKPLTLNTMQKKIDATIERLKDEGKPVRIIILKYRQGGASTYTEGRIFHSTSMTKLTNSLIVAHEDDASTNLFNMSKLFYDELPTELKPMKKFSNAKEVVFENPTLDQQEKLNNPGLRSRIKIATANNLGAGRSATIHNLHASEVAFWRDGKTIMLGLMQAVPNTPNTMVILESTANGVGGYFYDEWQRAKDKKSDFVPLFFAWFEEPQYQMDVPHDFEPTHEELDMMKRHPEITHRHLVWRRWCISNNCGGDAEQFKQEYPADDMEAFLVSGRPRFDIPVLREYLDKCVDGNRGYLERVNGRVQFIPDPKGYLEVWNMPGQSERYYQSGVGIFSTRATDHYIGADVAKGLVTGDASAAPVWDSKNNLNALWHGRIDPDLFADQLEMLGLWYNEALIAVEENNHGLTVLNKLKQSYSNLYRRTSHNKLTDESKKELGWYTSEQTKKLAIDNLARLIREKRLGIKSRRFIEECMTYVIEDDGKTNAQTGSHDDTVMAAAIILYVMEQYATPTMDIISPVGTDISEKIDSPFVMTSEGFRHRSEVREDDDDGWFGKGVW